MPLRPLACAIAVVALSFGSAVAVRAADPAAAADPLTHLGRDAIAVFNVDANATLQLNETDHGVTATRTLKVGDEYVDGWKISAIGTHTASLRKGTQARTVVLTGLPQAAPVATAPPQAVALAGSNAALPAAPRPVLLAPGAPPPLAEMTAALKRGASPRDIAALLKAGANPNINLDSAVLSRGPDGSVGLSATCDSGPFCRIFVPIPDSSSYAGLASLPTADQVAQDQEPLTVQGATAASSLVLFAGGTAQDAARAYLAATAGEDELTTGIAPDVSSARFFQMPGGAGVGLGTLSADGRTLNGIVIPNSQNYPGLSSLPTRDQAFPGNYNRFGPGASGG